MTEASAPAIPGTLKRPPFNFKTMTQLIIPTDDTQTYPNFKVSINGHHPNQLYLYMHEQLHGGLLRFQTTPIPHRGPIKKFGRLLFPISSEEEPFLYRRIQQLEAQAENEMLNYVSRQTTPEFASFNRAANTSLAAQRLIQAVDTVQAEAQSFDLEQQRIIAKALRPSYHTNNDMRTAWLKCSDELQIFNKKGERMEGAAEDILKAGTYELIIRASSISLSTSIRHSPDDNTIGTLMLRIAQIRYEPVGGNAALLPRSTEYLFKPPSAVNSLAKEIEAARSHIDHGLCLDNFSSLSSESENESLVSSHHNRRMEAMANGTQPEPFSLWPHDYNQPTPAPIRINSQSTLVTPQSPQCQPPTYGAPTRQPHPQQEVDWDSFWSDIFPATPSNPTPAPSTTSVGPVKTTRRRQPAGQTRRRKCAAGLNFSNPVDFDEMTQQV